MSLEIRLKEERQCEVVHRAERVVDWSSPVIVLPEMQQAVRISPRGAGSDDDAN